MNFSRPRVSAAGRATLVSFALAIGPAAAQDAAKDDPVRLPTYTVTDSRMLPPPEKWHYTRFPGFEVLSNASERTTRGIVQDLQRFGHAVSLVWPAARLPVMAPIALIICGRGDKFAACLTPQQRKLEFLPVAITLRLGEQTAIVVDAQPRGRPPGADGASNGPEVMGLLPTEITPGTANLGRGLEQTAARQLQREYIRFLLANTEPQAPIWFEEGLAQILMRIDVTRNTITVGRVADPNVSDMDPQLAVANLPSGPPLFFSERDFNEVFRNLRIPPTAEIFAVQRDSAGAANAGNLMWSKHCQAFVHWGLYGQDGRNQKAFITFLTRLGREPLTEALFQGCFKLTYAQMQDTLRRYVEFTHFKIAGVHAGKDGRLPEPPPLEVREATDAEAARINGEALRLAGNFSAARTVLATPYLRGERDPQLLAALGLLERAAGDEGRARKFIEAAAKARVVRPRLHLELAKLYFADAVAQPAVEGGRFSAEQTAKVLAPLFTALVQPPPLAEVYEVVAETWARSIVTPGTQHIAVLDDGVRLFPRNSALIYMTAKQKARVGLAAEAEALVTLGLKALPEGSELRAKFEALRASLPPVSAPAIAPQ